ncbi:MAG: hypothetical protein C0453_16015 [Comamonadaceae bacterium]|nr:hypothetical protein [Comamonadaceae bacterium]
MSLIHHPAFQSLGLPLLLTLVLTWLLGRRAEPPANRSWAMGAAIALLLSFVLLPGFDWPATARTQKLPWIVLGGTGLASLWLSLQTRQPGRWMRWATATAGWALACIWLTGNPVQWMHALLGTLAGAVVLAMLLMGVGANASTRGAHANPGSHAQVAAGGAATAGALTVAALGLAAIAAGSGSLLLAQLAMMLAVVTAVPGLWAWLRSASGFVIVPAALLPLGLAWLVLAYALAVTGPSAAARMAIIALAFVAPVLVARSSWAASHTRWAPLVAAFLAALPVVVALTWLLLGEAPPAGADSATGGAEDDLYYQPNWD